MTAPAAKNSGSLTFTLAGIPVTILPSFWFVTVMMVLPFQRSPALTAVWVAAVLVSVIVHELGHAFVARAFGGVPRIELHAMGGTAYPNGSVAFEWWQTILFTLAGPCAGVAFGAVVYFAEMALPPSFDDPIVATAIADLLWVNWGYGLLNFLPIVPLDGGHVMRAVIERVRGKPSPGAVAFVSLATAAVLAAVAVARGSNWAFVMLAWIALSHVRTLKDAWRDRRETKLEPEFAAIDAAIAGREFAVALQRAEALDRRVQTLRGRARVLSALAHIHMLENRPEDAVEAIERFSNGWRPDPDFEVSVWLRVGKPERAVRSMRARMAERDDPKLVRPFVVALLAAGDLPAAMRAALEAPDVVGRSGLFDVESALFHAGRFEESAIVAVAAFERFAMVDDAYNAACAYARLDRHDEAMAWLQRAVTAGYVDTAHLDADDDLAALKTREDYIALRGTLKSG